MDALGVCIIAYGARAKAQADMATRALHQTNDIPVCVISDEPMGAGRFVQFPDYDRGARWAKLNLDRLTPFELTLYMDADTRTRGDIMPIFAHLRNGFDLVMAPSHKQNSQCLHHLDNEEERAATFEELFNWLPLQLQGGVMGFKNNAIIQDLFSFWRCEWLRWRDKDQGALLRALDVMPRKPRIWILSNEYNDGAIVEHYYGQARRK